MSDQETSNQDKDFSIYTHPLIHLCLALSAEKDISKLLEIIVDKARGLTNAEAGSLYMVEKDRLSFEILQNEPMGIRYRKQGQLDAPLKDVPLYKNDQPNYSHVSSCVAITGEIINIDDIYSEKNFDFSGARAYDRSSGFRSRSMLTIPLKDHEDETVAVLQLINRKEDGTNRIISFSDADKGVIEAIASQTAVAIEKTKLIQDLKDLLYSFIKAIAWAVDAKSRYTGRHIARVVSLTMEIAHQLNETRQGIFKPFKLSDEQLEELKYAAWMHDVGKIVTPQYIVDKRTRLEGISDGIDLIKTRFDLIKQLKLSEYYHGENDCQTKDDIDREISQIDDDFRFLKTCNLGSCVMDEERIHRVHTIYQKTYVHDSRIQHFLTDDEVENLTIKKGTLTPEERSVIENHAVMTGKILEHVPFPKNMAKVPELASSHHEKPNGTGYPRHLTSDEIPIQAKILAIADIFEALTAEDRPYKGSMTLDKAISILSAMKDKNEIDPDLFEFCKESGIFESFSRTSSG